MAIRFLYFDLGNVLLSFCHNRMCRQMAAAAGVDAESVKRALFDAAAGPSLQWQFERGDFDAVDAYERFCGEIGVRPDMAELYAAGSDIFAPIPESVELTARLAEAGNRLGVLSNTNPVDWQFVTGRFAFLSEHFEQAALSFEAREMKPHRAIFDYAVRRAGVPAAEVFFTDDRAENVEGALAAGLDAVLYATPDELRAELRKRRVPGVE
jgi:putative hydrolase of the HAD superfamily